MFLRTIQKCSRVFLVSKPLIARTFSANTELIKFRTNISLQRCKPPTAAADNTTTNNRLVLLFAWMLANDRHVSKYREFWTAQGFDVLTVYTHPPSVILPMWGFEANARAVLSFLNKPIVGDGTPYEDVFVHAFSVGCHQFAELLHHCQKKGRVNEQERLTFYGSMRGWIFDSFVYPNEYALGFSRALTLHPIWQPVLEKVLAIWLALTRIETLDRFCRVQQTVHDNVLGVPGMMLYSDDDIVSSVAINRAILEGWSTRGIPTMSKCWQKSYHVSHRRFHQQEYDQQVLQFIELAFRHKLTTNNRRNQQRLPDDQ